jgi:outer membrane protein TolC
MKTPTYALIAVFSMAILAGCAVGPNYKAPAPPSTVGFVPSGALPDNTNSIDAPLGAEQRFIAGLDIPGQWWTLFQSPQINALIDAALKNSPTLEAAQATLRQANENLAAQRGSYYPNVSGSYEFERQKSSGAAFGEPGLGSSLYNLNSLSLNVSYTLDAFGGIRRQVEGLVAQADSQRFALEASYLSLTSNIVTAAVGEASLRAQVAATEDIARSEQKQLDTAARLGRWRIAG